MNTKLSLARCLLLILMMVLMTQPSNAQNCRWFSQSVPTEYAYSDGHGGADSIPFSTRLVQQKMVKEICCYEFEVAYQDSTRTFCIGIADSTVYTFKNNKFKNPKELLFLKTDIAHEVMFLTERCEAMKMHVDKERPDLKDVVVFQLVPDSYELFPGIAIRQIFVHSTRGLFFSFSTIKNWYNYSTYWLPHLM